MMSTSRHGLSAGHCLWLLLVIAAPADVSASWPPDGLPLSTASGYQSSVTIAPDGQGGVFAAWADAQTGSNKVFLQRVGVDGDIAPGWPPAGLPVCTAPGSQAYPQCVPDGLGGAVVVWMDTRDGVEYSIYAQRVLADGTIAQGWSTNGVPVLVGSTWSTGSFNALWMRAVTDGSGGAYVGLQYYQRSCVPDHPGCTSLVYPPQVVRLQASGVRGNSTSVGHPQYPSDFDMVSDGTGGAITATLLTAQPLMVCRISPAVTWLREISLGSGMLRKASLAPDGSGGAFIACEISTATNSSDIWAQRLTATGTESAGWPAQGHPVSVGPGFQGNPEAAPGEPGHLIVSWQDTRGLASNSPFDDANVFAQMVGPDGAPVPGWPTNGASVCSAPRVQSGLQLAYDGLGGAWITWLDGRDAGASNPSLFATRLSPTGIPAPAWPVDGQFVSGTVGSSRNGLVRSGQEGAIVAWQDVRTGVAWQDDVYAQRLVQDEPVAILVDLVMIGVSPRHVDLVGSIAGGQATRARLHRRTAHAEEVRLADLLPDGEGRISYRDLDVIAGASYTYRLGVLDVEGEVYSREIDVRIPSASRLALAAPVTGSGDAMTASVSLTGSGPASLTLVDLTGRRRAELDLGHLGPGDHVVAFAGSRVLPSGVYVLRLTEGSDAVVRKVCLIR